MLSKLLPDYDFKRIEEIPSEFFLSRGVKNLLLDVDNTLTGDNSQEVSPAVIQWLEAQRAAGLRLFVLSNNYEARVKPFAEMLGLEYIAYAEKPSTRVLFDCMRRLGFTPETTALIGDQLFTDILCGNRAGCLTILVEPYAMEGYGVYRIKRPLEKPLLRRYFRRKKEKEGVQ